MQNASVTATPVELHVISDATGETAARLVQALEAQFPDQPFREIRHPRVETVADLKQAVSLARGRPAVAVYTLVEPELREAMRQLCKARPRPLLRPARASDRGRRPRLGHGGANDPRCPARTGRSLLPAHGGDRVRGQVRRRPRRPGAVQGRHRARGRVADVEDAASIYLGYLGHKTANVPVVKGIEPPSELFEIDRSKIVGLTIEATRLAEIRQGARAGDAQPGPAVRGSRRDLRGAGGGGEGPAPPRLPDPRRVRELSIEETAHRIILLVEQRRAESELVEAATS